MHPEWPLLEDYTCAWASCSWPFEHIPGHSLQPLCSYWVAVVRGKERKKMDWWMGQRLKGNFFSSPFQLKSRLVCSSASGRIEDPWHQQTQIWLKCSDCWLRTSEWHLLSAQRDAFRCIGAGEDRTGCDSYHTADCRVVWGVWWHVARGYFVLWRTWSIYSKATATALRG